MILIADIQRAVAEQFAIPVAEMTSARRGIDVARPRQVAMFLARELTPQSIPEIGRRFGGRDHSTVIHALRQIERLRAGDKALDANISIASRRIVRNERQKKMDQLERTLGRIDDLSARKIVIMAMWEFGSITDAESEYLIRNGGLEAA